MKANNYRKEELFNKIMSRGFWEDIPERKEKKYPSLFRELFKYPNSLFNAYCMPDKNAI